MLSGCRTVTSMSAFDEEDTRGPRKPQNWVVVHKMVAVRAKPDVKSRLVGTKKQGETLIVKAQSQGWVKLGAAEFCLIEGSALGFGTLVERKDEPVTLKIVNPHDGSPFFDLAVTTKTTILECRRKVGDFVAPNGGQLRWQSIVPARGKMGTRIIDSKYNTFTDDMTVAACDLDDGDEFGFCYLGNAQEDLKL